MEENISRLSAIIAEPARTKMLMALMSGKALTATELAIEAGVATSTASSHLKKMFSAGLLVQVKQGRHKYFKLSGNEVAELLESLLNTSIGSSSGPKTGPASRRLCYARVCYDHLAGQLGVTLLANLQTKSLIEVSQGILQVTEKGFFFFEKVGAPMQTMAKARRPLCKNCLDWSERVFHLGGSLGKWILEDLRNKQWLVQDLDSRSLEVTQAGKQGLKRLYDVGS